MAYRDYFKRVLDVVVSVIALFALSWLFLLLILVYIVTCEFPVFFVQKRIGKDERVFTLLKFRTLKNTSGDLASRRFPLGSLMRSASLDELPQLWNVLCGHMSLVGPRPLPVAYGPLFSLEQRLRHKVRPGITGLAQINGRHTLSWPKKFQLDVDYVRNISFLLDLRIVFKTILLLISFRRDVSLEEKPFQGEQEVTQ